MADITIKPSDVQIDSYDDLFEELESLYPNQYFQNLEEVLYAILLELRTLRKVTRHQLEQQKERKNDTNT